MPIGYVTANQGESRYTVAIPRKTPLLAALIEARKVEIEGIDLVLEELRKHETERRAVYDAAMEDVHLATLMYTECRESYTEPQCRSGKIAAANSAYSDARAACFDAWRDCGLACDGDGDCLDGCSDARDACEAAAERVRDNALAAVDRLCVDEVVAHLAACQAEHAPIIASAQAAAVEALAPLQDVMIAITWERTKRTSAVRRLNELEAIESSAESATCWSAQYNEEIPTGEVPEEPTGDEENAVIVATVSGRSVITEISSVNPCAHDSRALPADVLFVDSALAPGAETWRPTWRTGIVTEIYDPAEPGDWPDPDKPLRVKVHPAILPGTLGTRVSRRNIECTPPGAFFDENGELDARLGIARQEYDDALEDLADVRAEIQACKDGYTVQECTAPRNEVCEYNREQSMMACIDNRDYCLSIAQDANGEQYCLDQFDACEQQVDAIFSACVDGVLADCIEAKRAHDSRCERDRQFDLSQAETAVSTAQRNLLNASADIQGPPFELLLDVPVAHCRSRSYRVGDDVLIDFPARATSTGLDWATATSAQIRAAAMAVWQSARVVGWASETRECAFGVEVSGRIGEDEEPRYAIACDDPPWSYDLDRAAGHDGEWVGDDDEILTWHHAALGTVIYRNGQPLHIFPSLAILAACRRDGLIQAIDNGGRLLLILPSGQIAQTATIAIPSNIYRASAWQFSRDGSGLITFDLGGPFPTTQTPMRILNLYRADIPGYDPDGGIAGITWDVVSGEDVYTLFGLESQTRVSGNLDYYENIGRNVYWAYWSGNDLAAVWFEVRTTANEIPAPTAPTGYDAFARAEISIYDAGIEKIDPVVWYESSGRISVISTIINGDIRISPRILFAHPRHGYGLAFFGSVHIYRLNNEEYTRTITSSICTLHAQEGDVEIDMGFDWSQSHADEHSMELTFRPFMFGPFFSGQPQIGWNTPDPGPPESHPLIGWHAKINDCSVMALQPNGGTPVVRVDGFIVTTDFVAVGSLAMA